MLPPFAPISNRKSNIGRQGEKKKERRSKGIEEEKEKKRNEKKFGLKKKETR